jgi:hypothetical protein
MNRWKIHFNIRCAVEIADRSVYALVCRACDRQSFVEVLGFTFCVQSYTVVKIMWKELEVQHI